MAVAEARAAWQRTANRFLVQEDAKRAPKLACCPSPLPSVELVDEGPTNATDAQDVPSVCFLPLNQNSSYFNLSQNSRWWLQLQPNYSFHGVLLNEQLNSVESEMECHQTGVSSACETPNCEDDAAFLDESVDTVSFVDSHFRIRNSVKNDCGEGKQDLKPIYKQNSLDSSKLEDARNLPAVAEMDSTGCAFSKTTDELFFYSESPWIGQERTEPWWHTADRDELALMVAQRSSGLIENCDLPQPQKTRAKRELFADPCFFDHGGIYVPSMDQKHPVSHCVFSVHSHGTLASVDRQLKSVSVDRLSDSTIQQAASKMVAAENDQGKAQLMEALRHSQTRAREAEKAAQKACAEKEHVVKLVFRQASQLFAYKQWLQLLQLENLYFQIRTNQKEPISTLFPVMLPWVPQKSRRLRESWQKPGRGKRAKQGRPRYHLNKYAVVFALGMSLVGAGLLLGWTVGWMLPF